MNTPEATKLSAEYDTSLIGCTVSTQEPDRFAYSLKTLIGLVMLERQCQAPEARQAIYHEFIQPHGAEICFVNDEILLGEVPEEKSKIIIPKKLGKRRWG